MPIVDELVTLLGVKTDSQSFAAMGKFGAGMDRIEKAANRAVIALAAASTAVSVWINSVAGALDETGKFAKSIGDSFEAIQELEFAVRRSGGSIGELRGDLDRLVVTFASLGAPSEILDQLAGQFENLTARHAKLYGQQLGLSESTIRLLRNGRDGLRELRMEARNLGAILPEEAAVQAAEYQNRLIDLQYAFDSLTRVVKLRLLPVFSQGFQNLTDFIRRNREFITTNIKEVIEGIAEGFSQFTSNVRMALAFIVKLLPNIKLFSGDFDTLGFTTDLVRKGFTALTIALVVFKAPLLLTAAAVTALILVVDDLVTLFSGGESVIGRLIERWPVLSSVIAGLVGAFVAFKAAVAGAFIIGKLAAVFATLKGAAIAFGAVLLANPIGVIIAAVGALVAALVVLYKNFDTVKDFIDRLWESFKVFAGNVAGLFKGVVEDIGSVFRRISDKIPGPLKGVIGGIRNLFGREENETPAGGQEIIGFRPQIIAPSAALSPGNTTNIMNQQGGNRIANITINGARDPRTVAQETVDRAGLRVTSQTIHPGLRAPVVR
jgi:hypothetical protein